MYVDTANQALYQVVQTKATVAPYHTMSQTDAQWSKFEPNVSIKCLNELVYISDGNSIS